MLVRMSFKTQRVFHSLRNFCGFRRWRSGLVGAVIFVTIGAPPNNAVSQFPGVGSEAPSGVATTAGDDVRSSASYAENSLSDAGNSGIGASEASSQSNYDGGSSANRSSDGGIPNSNLKKEHRRKKLFIKKLRLDFAAMEHVERKTGLPFSRANVPRYLDELRSDLKTMVTEAEKGKITVGALNSIARDAYLIETHLNDHLDQLLEQAGQPAPRKPFFAIKRDLPRGSLITGAEIDALSLKFELARYGEKALQAMGSKRY